ncbi:hypothetical protein I7I50_06912 [Histoplasma capsulatum G186AR]|uniref:Uncharacterized protein n=1 Tax=Ajellomyces capsulatus TaxID=5037 RepID=A0A8H7Z0L5_AJECA|nr:hypothetical protein I7I52_10014 [Histoplasma capsulatum]QSS67737.1 hypothetical protein I7I50_06912 [Histoplasma capsulatum G186AR]
MVRGGVTTPLQYFAVWDGLNESKWYHAIIIKRRKVSYKLKCMYVLIKENWRYMSALNWKRSIESIYV